MTYFDVARILALVIRAITLGFVWYAFAYSRTHDFPPGDQTVARLFIALAVTGPICLDFGHEMGMVSDGTYWNWANVIGPMAYLAICVGSFMFVRASRFRHRWLGGVVGLPKDDGS